MSILPSLLLASGPALFNTGSVLSGKYYAPRAHCTKKGPGRGGMGPKVNPAGTKLARMASERRLTKMN